jgi:aryl-alcohol dehydrogenase-like predicted oxidoreductase
VKRIAIGTAQFGLDYGVVNTNGQVPPAEARAILEAARAAGVDTLDTAVDYGAAEERLGSIGMEGWRVVTKLPAVPASAKVSEWVSAQIEASAGRLGVDCVEGVLLHRPAQLLTEIGRELWDAMVAAQSAGRVRRIGVSIYGPEELDALWPRFEMQIVQAPFNIIDRRLRDSGWLARLKAGGAEVHVRSVFLQGLLLAPSTSRPARFDRWSAVWRRWDSFIASTGLSRLEACLRFALQEEAIDRVVVGIDGLTQLHEILKAAAADGSRMASPDFGIPDPDLVNPARWATA